MCIDWLAARGWVNLSVQCGVCLKEEEKEEEEEEEEIEVVVVVVL